MSDLKSLTVSIENITPLEADDDNEAMVVMDVVICTSPGPSEIGDVQTRLILRCAADDSIESLQTSARSQLPHILRDIADQLEAARDA